MFTDEEKLTEYFKKLILGPGSCESKFEYGEDIYDSEDIVSNYQDAITNAACKAIKDSKNQQEIDAAEADAEKQIIEKQSKEPKITPMQQPRLEEQTIYQEKLREIKVRAYEPETVVFRPTKSTGIKRSIDRGIAVQKFPESWPLPTVIPPDHVLVQTEEGIIITKHKASLQQPPILFGFSSYGGNAVTSSHLINVSSTHHETIAGTSVLYNSKRESGMNNYPAEFNPKDFNYISSEGKEIGFDFGHGIDFKHGNGATTYCRENYTPQNPMYNRTIREQGLIKRIPINGYYSEIAIYSNNPKITTNGTKIPEGFIFNVLDESKKIKESYYISNWNTEKEYKKYTKSGEKTKTQVFLESYRIMELNILTPIIYDNTKDHEYYLEEIRRKFLEAIKILKGQFKELIKNENFVGVIPNEAKDALVQFIILNLLEQAGSLEYISTYYRCSLVAILLGVSRIANLETLKDDSRANELLQTIEEQTLQELELLTFRKKSSLDMTVINQHMQSHLEYRQKPSEWKEKFLFKDFKRAYHEQDEYWGPEEYQKMINQMIDLYDLCNRCSGSSQVAQKIYECIKREVLAAREEGFIILCNIEPIRFCASARPQSPRP